jgi:hypothetical protein
MPDDGNNNFSVIIEKNIVAPVKQKFNSLSVRISAQEKKIRLMQLGLLLIFVLLTANVVIGIYLLIKVR